LSFLAFQIYQRVKRILWKKTSEVEFEMKLRRISWTPSFSVGRLLVLIEGVKENHTARGRSQWKNRWASSSTAIQVEQ
jgi:hypothetical protein